MNPRTITVINAIGETIERRDHRIAELETLIGDIDKVRKAITDAERQWGHYDDDPKTIAWLINRLDSEIRGNDVALTNLRGEIDRLKGERDKLAAEATAAKAELATKQERLDRYRDENTALRAEIDALKNASAADRTVVDPGGGQ